MHVMIIGAAGMRGMKLSLKLSRMPAIAQTEINQLTLVDVIPPSPCKDFSGKQVSLAADLSSTEAADQLISMRPDIIFHLAAIVSGEAEADFDKGYQVNLDGTRQLFESIRHAHRQDGYYPRVIFTSSIAVFGTPLPNRIDDEYLNAPLTSYGTQKAICELLLSDYSRRGIMNGIAIRLPTICIRPGKPNRAASGFFSNILREPLVGQEAILPVSEDVRHWFASPRAGVNFLIHAATVDLGMLGWRRALSMPGISATVGEELIALRHVAGEKALRLIRREPDETIVRIVAGWPSNFKTTRALALGFRAEQSFEEIIRVHIEDELNGHLELP